MNLSKVKKDLVTIAYIELTHTYNLPLRNRKLSTVVSGIKAFDDRYFRYNGDVAVWKFLETLSKHNKDLQFILRGVVNEDIVSWYTKRMKERQLEKNADIPVVSHHTKKWSKLRKKVLAFYGKRCMKCGYTGPKSKIHIDHIKPKSKYPELEFDFNNLQVLCEPCNMGKSNLHEIDYRGNKTSESQKIEPKKQEYINSPIPPWQSSEGFKGWNDDYKAMECHFKSSF